MDLNIQWFIYALVDNQIMELERCVAIYEQLEDSSSLEDYAQEVLNEMAQSLSPEEAEELLEQFQIAIQFAIEQAEEGDSPGIFPESEILPEPDIEVKSAPAAGNPVSKSSNDDIAHFDITVLEGFPDFTNIDDCSDEEVGNMLVKALHLAREYGASDFHISADSPPFMRHNLQIKKLSNDKISPENSLRINTAFLSPEQREYFTKKMDLNCAQKIEDARYRVSLMMHRTGVAGSYHIVPNRIQRFEELGFLPEDAKTLGKLLDYHNGLILVTGPLGSGKTTTLSAMMDVLNDKRQDHLIAVEDPIEIVHDSHSCIITQREVGVHTKSYSTALKGALREDPDIIVIGELHNLETIENAITASETGHLVIGTLHTRDAANTLNRLLDVFPPSQQQQIRTMTAGSLRGIVCQQLLPDVHGHLTVAYEILVGGLAVSNIIVENMTHRLKSVMETGQKAGMCTFEGNVVEKYKRGLISAEIARKYVRDKSIKAQLEAEIKMKG